MWSDRVNDIVNVKNMCCGVWSKNYYYCECRKYACCVYNEINDIVNVENRYMVALSSQLPVEYETIAAVFPTFVN